jgi:DNA mismatch endonuclease (patch repair protein)
VAKIRRNKERDREEQRRLAEMGWHCITVWECELKPSKREETLDAIAFTLNHIWLQDHSINPIPRIARISRISDAPGTEQYSYPQISEEDGQMPMAAEEIQEPERQETEKD